MGRAKASITRPFQDLSGRSVRAWVIRARAPMAARCASSKGRTRIDSLSMRIASAISRPEFRLDRNPIAKLYEFRESGNADVAGGEFDDVAPNADRRLARRFFDPFRQGSERIPAPIAG